MNLIKIFIAQKYASIVGKKDLKYSMITVLVLVFISTILLLLNIIGATYDYSVGDIARADIKVSRELSFINESATETEKSKVIESIPIVFDRDASILQEKLNNNAIMFKKIDDTLENHPLIGAENFNFLVYLLKSKLPESLKLKDDVLSEFLRSKNPEELKKIINQILIYIFDDNEMGILDKPYENPLKINNNKIAIRVINTPLQKPEVTRTLTDLKTIDEVKEKVYWICYSITPNLPKNTIKAVSEVVSSQLQPNLYFNIEETRRRMDESADTVKPVTDILKKGQTIVREGDLITQDILGKIRIYNRSVKSLHLNYIFGTIFLQLIFLVIFGYFILEYRKVLIPDSKSTMIIFSIVFTYMLYTLIIAKTEIVSYSRHLFVFLLPIPLVTMIISILYNMYLAMLVGMYIIFFTVMISQGDVSIAIIAFSSALLGVYVNGRVERRTDFLRGGLILGLFNALLLIAVTLVDELPLMNALKNIHFPILNGIVNSIIVLGILPIYENVFGVTTKFKLMELSDLNAEIFKRMLVEAPGTYNHSLIVSTMAETACKEINANHLIARVGAFYHDVGKIIDAGMYIENKITDPRAKFLSSRDYCRLIISHVQKGMDIAKKEALPEFIIKFIREHHGKSTMSFFYHKALEEADMTGSEHSFDKSDFQYPGPKPDTKECAVVLLADAVEAASRSLREPTRKQLEGLVRKIVYNKLNEGELEDSHLSMVDLNLIQKSFMTILNGLYHTRIEYPDREEVKDLEDKVLSGNGKG